VDDEPGDIPNAGTLVGMSVDLTVQRLGGWATWRELRSQHPRRAIERAVKEGVVIKVGHNRYTVPGTVDAMQDALRLGGHLSHLSAALHHGWKVKTVPELTWVTLPRSRGALRCSTDGVHVHRSDLPASQSRDRVTTPLRTVIDCARVLPFDEALAVADSALRSRKVSPAELRAAAADARGPGSAAVRRVALHASAKADNPLESVLRALTIEVGLAMTPQLQVAESGMFAVVDLGNEELRLIVEAEGYETHGTRKGLRRDCCRHTEFAIFGWTSLRYAYEDTMFEQEWVRWSLLAWLALTVGTPQPKRPRHSLSRAA
jgi:hypothetical protein